MNDRLMTALKQLRLSGLCNHSTCAYRRRPATASTTPSSWN